MKNFSWKIVAGAFLLWMLSNGGGSNPGASLALFVLAGVVVALAHWCGFIDVPAWFKAAPTPDDTPPKPPKPPLAMPTTPAELDAYYRARLTTEGGTPQDCRAPGAPPLGIRTEWLPQQPLAPLPPYVPAVKAGPQATVWHAPDRTYSDRIRADVDDAMRDLGRINYQGDPLLAARNLQHLIGVCHSAITRHGHLIECALFESLADKQRFAVWHREPIDVPDGRGGTRKIEVDLIVYDRKEFVVRGYEIKRGMSGGFGSHVERQTRANFAAVESRLMPFVQERGHPARAAHMHLISYYGRTMSQVVGGVTLTRDGLNEQFGYNISAHVEEMTDYFRDLFQRFLTKEGLWDFDAVLHDPPPAAPVLEPAE